MSNDYDEIVKKLHNIYGNDSLIKLLDERATLQEALTKLTAERDALREALKPFAKEAENWGGAEHASSHPACDISGSACTHCGDDPEYGKAAFTVGDLRRARATLKQDEGRK